MTWYAVKNDVVGGWAVANRQAPMSQLDFMMASGDVAICDRCESEEAAYLIAGALNFLAAQEPEWVAAGLMKWSKRWPSAEAEG